MLFPQSSEFLNHWNLLACPPAFLPLFHDLSPIHLPNYSYVHLLIPISILPIYSPSYSIQSSSICLAIHPSFFSPSHLPFHPSSIFPFIYPFSHSLIYLTFCLSFSIHLSICLLLYPSIHPFFYSSTDLLSIPSIHSSIYTLIHPSLYKIISYPSIIHLFTHPSTQPSIHPYVPHFPPTHTFIH